MSNIKELHRVDIALEKRNTDLKPKEALNNFIKVYREKLKRENPSVSAAIIEVHLNLYREATLSLWKKTGVVLDIPFSKQETPPNNNAELWGFIEEVIGRALKRY